MKPFTPFRLALCLALAALARAGADPTPLDATVAVSAEAQLPPSPLQFNRDTVSTDATLQELTDYAYAQASSGSNFAYAYTSVDATWDGPGSGQVAFGDTGFVANAAGLAGTVDVRGTHWTYRLRTGTENRITLGYAVTLDPSTTDPTGLAGFRFAVVKEGYDPIANLVLAPGASGTLAVALEPQTVYAVSLIVEAGLTADDLGTRTALMTGNFSWAVDRSQ